MTEPYAECSICKYSFLEPDLDESGQRIKCPICGALSRKYYIEEHEEISLVSSTANLIISIDARPELEAQFDIEQSIAGRTIIECSGLIDEKFVEFFRKYPEELRLINRRKFEELVAELFDGFGYEIELTKRTRDGGRDIVAVKKAEVQVKYLIECKRPDPGGYVGIRPVREILGIKTSERATKAILATTAYFSRDARTLFEKHKWELELKEYEDLKEWIDIYLKLKGERNPVHTP